MLSCSSCRTIGTYIAVQRSKYCAAVAGWPGRGVCSGSPTGTSHELLFVASCPPFAQTDVSRTMACTSRPARTCPQLRDETKTSRTQSRARQCYRLVAKHEKVVVTVLFFGGLVVWGFGGLVVWGFGGLVVWWSGGWGRLRIPSCPHLPPASREGKRCPAHEAERISAVASISTA